MLNHDMDAVVLVKGWKKGANWSFPRGKINKDEPDLDCAIREVYEETGFDVREAGLVANEEHVKYIEITMREQHMRLYVFRDVPMDTQFEPRTRKEISKIQWYKLSELPTLKKGKNQQEGNGEDLANNANKFYMVAPFLVPLKKWISQQKKLDKRESSGQPELMVPAVHDFLEETSKNSVESGIEGQPGGNDMERLLASLRQSGQFARASDPPELSVPPPAIAETKNPREVRLQPTSAILNMQALHDQPSTLQSPTSDRQKSNALLALLKGDRATEVLPQTPAEQVIENPQMPPSPKHRPAQLEQHQGSSNASLYPHHTHHTQDAIRSLQSEVAGVAHTVLQRQAIHQPLSSLQDQGPNPLSRGVLNPHQSAHFQNMNSQASSGTRLAPAPYQRTGDPSFTHASQPAGFPSSIPPASKLPPPKLTSHSSALLTLFKAGPGSRVKIPSVRPRPDIALAGNQPTFQEESKQNTSKGPTARESEPPAHPPSGDGISEMSGVDSGNDPSSHRGISKPISTAAEETTSDPDDPYANDPKVQAAMIALRLVPPKARSKPSAPVKPKTEHQDALLNLAQNPSATTFKSSEPAKSSLELPHASFELPALPSPGHSREPSRVNEGAGAPLISPSARHLQQFQQKQTKAVLTTRKSPVSATVDGPLNVPQFDKLPTKSKADSMIRNGSTKKINTILSKPIRPPPFEAESNLNGLVTMEELTPVLPNTIGSAQNLTVKSVLPGTAMSTPVKVIPISQGQPETIRRPHPPVPKPSHNDTILSPMDPLPSPKHILPVNRRANQTQEQKKSLLALFSNPMPPPVETPTRVGSASASLPVMDALQDGELGSMEQGKMASIASQVRGGERIANAQISSGRQTPRTTPTDRTFLLSYLDSVARGEIR